MATKLVVMERTQNSHTHTHTRTYAYTQAHTCTHTQIHAYTHAHTDARTLMHTCRYTSMHTHTQTRACVHEGIHIENIHRHTHVHMHTHTHAYSPTVPEVGILSAGYIPSGGSRRGSLPCLFSLLEATCTLPPQGRQRSSLQALSISAFTATSPSASDPPASLLQGPLC